jgi:hypothetical protein
MKRTKRVATGRVTIKMGSWRADGWTERLLRMIRLRAVSRVEQSRATVSVAFELDHEQFERALVKILGQAFRVLINDCSVSIEKEGVRISSDGSLSKPILIPWADVLQPDTPDAFGTIRREIDRLESRSG